MRTQRHALFYALTAIAAAIVLLGRWMWQGTGNLWSKLDLKVYLADADLGWRRTEQSFTWVGLDLVAALLIASVGIYLAIRYLGSREKTVLRWLGTTAKVASVGTLVLPLYAFASGSPPQGARESRPVMEMVAPKSGILASLPSLPDGRYLVISHPQSAVTAKLLAGGEEFDARFSAGLGGYWDATPHDLSKPMHVQVQVDVSSVETGIELRNQHTLDALKPSEHPTISFKLKKLVSTEASPGGIAFSATGEVGLVGRTHLVDVVGTLRAVDTSLATKLGLSAGTHILLQSSFSLNLKETSIGNDGTFDVDVVPISVTLVLKHSE
ncbi:MAG: hypothetical protein GY811_30300 [Myxococcales bacterium]|nr:hypothetical protein [Myxococcales bacterium]